MSAPTLHRLEPAYSVIDKLGGKSTVAKALEISPSSVSRWCTPQPSGTGGTIPQRYWKQLFRLARMSGVSLRITELVPR
jgi:hypothetical protein